MITIEKTQGVKDNDAILANATAMFIVGIAGFIPLLSMEAIAEGPILAVLLAAWATMIGSAGAF